MSKQSRTLFPGIVAGFLLTFSACKEEQHAPAAASIEAINLKRGEVVVCGAAEKQFGSVGFSTSCSEKVKPDFDLAISLLHSFEYDEAEKVFAKVIDKDPTCPMAYWGVAMSNYHPLWAPPTEAELEKGNKSIAIAKSLENKSKREGAYVDAIALFYKDWNASDHKTRSARYEKAMEKVYADYPADKEAAIFYALALTAAADPADKTFEKQNKAGNILTKLYEAEPNHPGVVHYIIHTFDSPELAELGLQAARKYASVAPSSAHALHMPSHIFTRLGLWNECISSNLASVSSAQCYAESSKMKGHWDEELHGLDYLVYAHLQKGENRQAKEKWDYVKSIKEVQPVNFKVAYAYAAIPSRYLLENRLWSEASSINSYKSDFPWQKYPWQKSIIHFTRALGFVHMGNPDSARAEVEIMKRMQNELLNQKDLYKANQVDIQVKAAEAWIMFKEGKKDEALKLMTLSADMEDKTEKHPVTPGAVIPARELLADMLLQSNKAKEALLAYEDDLLKQPNRFNGLYGAAKASEMSNNTSKAKHYYKLLTDVASVTETTRPELVTARSFLQK